MNTDDFDCLDDVLDKLLDDIDSDFDYVDDEDVEYYEG